MTLVKWKRRPDAMPSLFSSYLDNFLNDDFFKTNFGTTHPSVNIRETDSEFWVEFAAPGYDKGDFHVDVNNDMLTVSAEKKTESNEEQENFKRREFNYTNFSRSFNIPEMVNVDSIDAAYKDGILSVKLPKKEVSEPAKKTIKIS